MLLTILEVFSLLSLQLAECHELYGEYNFQSYFTGEGTGEGSCFKHGIIHRDWYAQIRVVSSKCLTFKCSESIRTCQMYKASLF